jgi:hypothetical protein
LKKKDANITGISHRRDVQLLIIFARSIFAIIIPSPVSNPIRITKKGHVLSIFYKERD